MRIRGPQEAEGPRPPRQGGGERPDAPGPSDPTPLVPRPSNPSDEAKGQPPDQGGPAQGVGTSTETQLAEFLWQASRQDAYAVEATEGWRVKKQVRHAGVYEDHLSGDYCVGVFPIREDGTAQYVCFDVDTRDRLPVLQLMAVVSEPCVLEDTGGRGYHLWVLFDSPVPAEDVFDYAQSIIKRAGVTVETYPKQGDTNGGLGNLIRLPGGVHTKTGKRSQVLSGEINPVPFPELSQVSGTVYTSRGGSEGEGWVSAMFEGDTSIKNGRNNTLRAFYFWLQRRGVPFVFAADWCRQVNAECFDPPLDEDELTRTCLRGSR